MPNAPAKFALHIGLNDVDLAVYGDEYIPLIGCLNDTDLYAELTLDFETRSVLRDSEATRNSVLSNLQDLATSASPQDLVVITYAGHGSQVDDTGGDELIDGKDEVLVLYDGLLIDDEINKALLGFEPGVDIVWISDSCHSGSNTRGRNRPSGSVGEAANLRSRLLSTEIAQSAFDSNAAALRARTEADPFRQTPEVRLPFKANIVTLAACQDNQEALELGSNGLFTVALVKALESGSDLTYESWLDTTLSSLPTYQTPKVSKRGPRGSALLNQRIWTQRRLA